MKLQKYIILVLLGMFFTLPILYAEEPLYIRPLLEIGPGFDTNKYNDLYSVRQSLKKRAGGLVVLSPSLNIDYLSDKNVNIRLGGGADGEYFFSEKNAVFYKAYGLLDTARYYRSWKIGATGIVDQFRIPENNFNHYNHYRTGLYLKRYFNYRIAFDLKAGYGKKTFIRRITPDGKTQEDKQLDYEAGISWQWASPFWFRFFYGYVDDDANADTEDYRENRYGAEFRWKKHPPTEVKLYLEYANLDFAASPIAVRNFTSEREDNRYRVDFSFTRRLLDYMDVRALYRYISNQSNDPDERYTKHHAEVAVGIDFWAYLHQMTTPVLPRRIKVPIPGRAEVKGNKVFFTWKSPKTSKVSVVGDFNDWDINRNSLYYNSADNLFEAELKLNPGKHQYMFVINGTEWLPPQNEKKFEPGMSGKTVGVFYIE